LDQFQKELNNGQEKISHLQQKNKELNDELEPLRARVEDMNKEPAAKENYIAFQDFKYNDRVLFLPKDKKWVAFHPTLNNYFFVHRDSNCLPKRMDRRRDCTIIMDNWRYYFHIRKC